MLQPLVTRTAVVLVVFWTWASPVTAQWITGIELGADRYWGGSAETTAEHRSFRPYRPTSFGVGLERRAGSLAWGLRANYAEAALALEGEDATASIDGVFKVLSILPEAVYRLATLGPVSELRLHAGPLFEMWDIVDEDTRFFVGAQGAVSLDVPLGGRLAGMVLGGLAVSPSPFENDELGDGFEPRTLWRRRFAGGLRYRL
jgi:hypothetical protein